MQFLLQQRKGRKRKSYLEKIGLNDKIKSSVLFYENYKVLKKLKSGGQGTIHCIQEKKSHETEQEYDEEEGNETKRDKQTIESVVKIISLSHIDDEENIKNELLSKFDEYEVIKKLKLLNHKDIYYDEKKKEILIVTEKLISNLSELKYDININIENEDNLKKIMCDILENLNILHNNGYCHCDINPFNIMIDNKNNYKLIDFDMMSKMDLKRGYIHDFYKGTVGWVSKEICKDISSSNNKYSFSSDLWSFGLCLFYILNDFKNPFDLNELIKNKLNDDEALKLEYYYKYKITRETHQELQFLLITFLATNKISFYLYDLLINHLLVFDVEDRCKSCKQLIKHPWFYGYIKNNKQKYQSLFSIME